MVAEAKEVLSLVWSIGVLAGQQKHFVHSSGVFGGVISGSSGSENHHGSVDKLIASWNCCFLRLMAAFGETATS